MDRKNVEVRGCCFGIPFGCGTLLGGIGIAAWLLLPISPTTLWSALGGVALTVVLALVALIAIGWIDENRRPAERS